MSIAEAILGLQPLRGEVIPIRTIQETQPIEDFDNAYVVEVNVKAASKVIKALDSTFPRDTAFPVSHLRRFCKRDALPASLRAAIEAKKSSVTTSSETIFVMIPPPLPPVEQLLELLAPFAPGAADPSSTTTDASTSLSGTATPNIPLVTAPVPVQPPFNPIQAEKWTSTMWPVVFNPSAPRSTVAPPPQVLNRAQNAIQPRAGYYLALSRKVAEEAKQLGRGRGVGAVIVDPAIEAEIENAANENGTSNTDRWVEAVIAVGGDARYGRSEAGALSQADLHHGAAPNPASTLYNADLEGGPDLHALMRATELVACRRREDPMHEADMTAKSVPNTSKPDPQLVTQLSPLESYFLHETEAPFTASRSNPIVPPVSPQKRKHGETNPESTSAPPDLTAQTSPKSTPSQAFETSLPALPLSTTALADSAHTQSQPDTTTTDAETANWVSRIRTRSQGGYLCTDLDIYLSHEPCLCCSMGMLLSRFRAVIFPRRGRMISGGISSEPVVAPVPADDGHEGEKEGRQTDQTAERIYYGLHWRKELNWRALGFEFVEDDENGDERIGDGTGHDVVFHA